MPISSEVSHSCEQVLCKHARHQPWPLQSFEELWFTEVIHFRHASLGNQRAVREARRTSLQPVKARALLPVPEEPLKLVYIHQGGKWASGQMGIKKGIWWYLENGLVLPQGTAWQTIKILHVKWASIFWKGRENQPDPKASSGKTLPKHIWVLIPVTPYNTNKGSWHAPNWSKYDLIWDVTCKVIFILWYDSRPRDHEVSTIAH